MSLADPIDGGPTRRSKAQEVRLGALAGRSTLSSVQAMLKEFKEFAFKGNMIDMAVGIILGGAFGLAVKSLVDNVLMPFIGNLMGGLDFKDYFAVLGGDAQYATLAAAEKAIAAGEKLSIVKWGTFVNDVINLVIVAFSLFMMVKYVVNASKKKEEEAPAAPPANEVLLAEIRDLLKK